MCLAVPGLVTDILSHHGLAMAAVDFGGVSRRVCIEHVPDVRPGDYVLVHVGFALSRIDADEARRLFELLNDLNEVPG
ncbi:Hydrogenase maturation protein HypC [Nannocystis exedens]|uniref:Hydrogenase maturation protein HypC n=1 Tax=Nannocystis exedens TaxID=54 RepID=A0A1I2FFT3_9BACT|nr:HypC/HybG/HupF family hydrogenase formation chaperone [Nannocystis exedens]PCC70441.1 hydrogenase assembly protein HypC [Nannocystis exedens]SFF04262.1 Hydrogenase maturation protein HypC [Nannocystis exedens]